MEPLCAPPPNEVSIADPTAISKIYDARGTFAKTDLYDVWEGKNVFAERDEALHAPRRQIVNQVYSMTNVLESERYVDQVTTSLRLRTQSLACASGSRGTQQMSWASQCLADHLALLTRDPGVQGYLSSRNVLLQLISTMSVAPSYTRPFSIPLALLSSQLCLGFIAFQDLIQWAKDAVAERRDAAVEGTKVRVDMMDKLYKIVQEKGERLDFGRDDVAIEVGGALFKQVRTQLRSPCRHHIVSYEKSLGSAPRKLHSEIDAAAVSGILSSPHIRYHDAIKLLYPDACIKESMRLHPPLGTSMPHHVPAGGAKLAGEFFPESVKIGVNPAVVQYDKGVFGDDADVFRPERWLTADEVQLAQMERMMLIFGAGKRTCLGMQLSCCKLRFQGLESHRSSAQQSYPRHNHMVTV